MSLISSSFIEAAGYRLETVQSPGTGDPVFLFHGNSCGAQAFEALLRSPLGRRHRLVACSFPGHGASSAPGEDCSVPALGRLAAEVVAAFGASRYALVGHSLGAHALYEALEAFDGALGLVAVSAPPLNLQTLAQAFQPDPSGGALFKGELSAGEVEALAGSLTNVPALAPRLAGWIRETDPRFRPALGASLAQGRLHDEIAAVQACRFPVALFVGEADRYIRPEYYDSLAGLGVAPAAVVRFPGCGHAVQLDDPAAFEAALAAFLASIGARAGADAGA